jgi:hypothetical protein
MASSGKRKTTMAKLTRESKLRDKRAIKEARKAQRKQESAEEGSDSIGYNDEEYFGRLAEDPTASTGS